MLGVRYRSKCGMSLHTFLIKEAIRLFGSLLQCKQTHRLVFMCYVIRWKHMENCVWGLDQHFACACSSVLVCLDWLTQYPSQCASINETNPQRQQVIRNSSPILPKSLLAAALLSLINAIKTSLPIHTLLNYDYYYWCRLFFLIFL